MSFREDYYRFAHYFFPYSVFKYPQLMIDNIKTGQDRFILRLKNIWNTIPLENAELRNTSPNFNIEFGNITERDFLIRIEIPEANEELEARYLGISYDENYKVRYFTYEIGQDLDGNRNYVLCEWTPEWNHIVYEFYKDDNKDIFIKGIKKIYNE